MNELSRGSLEYFNEKLFINNTEILGVQSIDYSYPEVVNNYKYLGMTNSVQLFNNNPIANLSISKILYDKDHIWNFTGSSGFNCLILQNNKSSSQNISFNSGYLASYSLNCVFGRLPEIQAEIVGFGYNGNLEINNYQDLRSNFNNISLTPNNYFNAGFVTTVNNNYIFSFISGESPNSYINTGDFLIISGIAGSSSFISGAATGITTNSVILDTVSSFNATGIVFKQKRFNQMSSNSINLNIDEFSTNRVNRASFTANFERLPVYYIGNKYPSEVKTNYPYNVTCEFELEIDSYTLRDLTLFPTGNLKQQNIRFQFMNYSGNREMMNYQFNNMTLISESFSIQSEDVVKVNLIYRNDI